MRSSVNKARRQAHPDGMRKVHPKGRKGDILILPFQAARHSDFAGPDLAAEQRSSDPAVKSTLYGLGLIAHCGGN